MPIEMSWKPATGAAAVTAAITPMLVLASPASAHNVCSYHPSDPSTACLIPTYYENGTYDPHGKLLVCDRQADGHNAYARTRRHGVIQNPLYDNNGASAGCTAYQANPSTLERFNVCVQQEECGSPVFKANY
jgi:hypothetical protein